MRSFIWVSFSSSDFTYLSWSDWLSFPSNLPFISLRVVNISVCKFLTFSSRRDTLFYLIRFVKSDIVFILYYILRSLNDTLSSIVSNLAQSFTIYDLTSLILSFIPSAEFSLFSLDSFFPEALLRIFKFSLIYLIWVSNVFIFSAHFYR